VGLTSGGSQSAAGDVRVKYIAIGALQKRTESKRMIGFDRPDTYRKCSSNDDIGDCDSFPKRVTRRYLESKLFRRTEDAQHINHAIVVQRHYNSALEFSIVVNPLVYSKHQYHYHAVMGK
jgi:hypothetical protein